MLWNLQIRSRMSAIKTRGKSSLAVAQEANGINVNQAYGPSPLRIEPVTPGLNRNIHNRSIHRSYSTLSSGYIKKVADLKSDHDNTNKKSNGSISNGANVVQHGFWRIQRSAKDKDKLPDRINLDRRGLTTLPLIEDETNLRLLSLQHNLINSFCVPSSTPPVDSHVSERKSMNVEVSRRRGTVCKSAAPSNLHGKMSHGRKLVKTQSVQKPSSSSSSSTSRNLQVPNNAKLNGHMPKSGMANGGIGLASAQAMANNSIKNSFIQKSVLLHAKERYVLRKSTSFINSYSRHLSATKAHLGRLIQSRVNVNGAATGNGLMSSFSSDSTQDIELKPQADGLIVQNDHSYLGFSDSLQNLVFLDLYDNQIEKISNLDGLRSLTVLLLGKNRINDIAGIVSLKHSLRVLDLHGNKIGSISQKICQLQELKSLNLAGNNLKQIHADDFKGLINLKELNLKRNRIKKILGFEDLRSLERLWLCHNDLQRVEDMSSIAKALALREVTIENNPVSLGGDCVSFLVSYLPNLCLLSQMQVTDQVRRAAMIWRKGKHSSDTKYSQLNSDVGHTVRREEIISNARTNWELLRSQQHVNRNLSFIDKSIKNNANVPVSEVQSELLTDLSEATNVDAKVIRQKTFMIRKNLRKPSAKMRRSSSQEALTTPTNAVAKQDDNFRLPPILAPFIEPKPLQSTSGSNSSTGVNIDSASSCMNSETDDDGKVISAKGQDWRPIMCEQNGAKVDVTIVEPSASMTETPAKPSYTADVKDALATVQMCSEIIVDEDNRKKRRPTDELQSNGSTRAAIPTIATDDTEKSSNLSVTSIKCPSDMSAERYQKCKSASTVKKHQPGTLQRSNTAKSAAALAPPPAPPNPAAVKTTKPTTSEREREQGGDYLIEICGRYLNIYGAGAVKFIDRQWNTQKANDVHTLKFSYLNFNSIAPMLNRIKVRFPNAENFFFRETNINCLGQLNALAELQGISCLVIDAEGNFICTKSWRLYAIYRLCHWGIKTINDVDVTEQEIADSLTAYSGLSDLVLWSLPETLLEPLLLRLRLDESCTTNNLSAKQWLMDADASLKNVVGKEALQCKPAVNSTAHGMGNCQTESDFRQRGKSHIATMMANTYNAVEKLQKLETMWPNLLLDIIKNTLLDYAQIDVYVRNLMTELNTTPAMPPGKH